MPRAARRLYTATCRLTSRAAHRLTSRTACRLTSRAAHRLTSRTACWLTGGAARLALALAIVAGGAAQALTADERAAMEAARTGEMTKLVVHDAPKGPYETAFVDGDGGEIRLTDFAGKVVLVNFWATWCPPCLKEMPALDRLAAALEGEDFALVAISADRGSADKPRRWLAENAIARLRLHHDPRQALSREVGVLGMPTTLLLDRQGREVARLLGDAEWDSAEARAVIDLLIAAAP